MILYKCRKGQKKKTSDKGRKEKIMKTIKVKMQLQYWDEKPEGYRIYTSSFSNVESFKRCELKHIKECVKEKQKLLNFRCNENRHCFLQYTLQENDFIKITIKVYQI